MKKIQFLTLILTFLSIGTMLFAGGFALSGVGSRATSMGGAFRGMADDASAMYWNPAGLGFMDEMSVGLGGTFILPSSTWDPTGTALTGIPGFSAKEYEAEKSLRSFPNLFATMAKNPKLKYGLGVFIPYGLGTTWDAYNQAAVGISSADFPTEEMMSSIAIIDVHPSVAYQITPCLSAGLGISAMYGTIEIAKLQFPFTGVAPAYYSYATPKTTDLNGSGMGFGANFGLLFKPMDKLSVGVSGKLPSEISLEGDVETYTWSAPSTRAGGVFDIESALKLPGEVGLGVSYKVMPSWVVNLDYAYTMWDRLDEVVVDITIPSVGVVQDKLLFNWESTSRISLGTEYLKGCNAFRAGVYYDQTPIPLETQTPTLSDVSDKVSGNLGYGRLMGKFTIDANVQYVGFTEREVITTNVDSASHMPTNMMGKYNSNSISGNIGIGYRF
ncbi:MAG: hypothetical protein CVU50_09655 [Candidatus Cloacimonetes bacterium HGW-Cloacimonetes-3]|jgi:long-chain fatty acid transport protein|nr:MAG: hypothetical protein CVU50_09655 [Candidatus Cloacimonetes bacterium HGW-Cloacimonetes-3]